MPEESPSPDALNQRAVSLARAGDDGAARAAWSEALSRDPDHLESLLNRALFAWSRGESTDLELLGALHGLELRLGRSGTLTLASAFAHAARLEIPTARGLLETLPRGADPRTEEGLTLVRDWTRAAAGLDVQRREEHGPAITWLGLAADGSAAVSLDETGDARLWSGSLEPMARVDTGFRVASADLTPDGRLLALAGREGQVQLWELDRPGRPRLDRDVGSDLAVIHSIAVSPDGSRVVTASSPPEEQVAWTEHDTEPDGDFGSDLLAPPTVEERAHRLHVWALEGPTIRPLEGGAAIRVEGLTASGRALCVGPGGRIWDLDTRTRTWSYDVPREAGFADQLVPVAKLSVAGDRVLMVDPLRGLTLHDVDTSALLWHTSEALLTLASLLAWSPSGRALVVLPASAVNPIERVGLWDVDQGRCLRTFDVPNGITALALSGDGTRGLAAHRDGSLTAWRFPESWPAPVLLSSPTAPGSAGADASTRRLLREAAEASTRGDSATALSRLVEVRALGDRGASREVRTAWRRASRSLARCRLRAARVVRHLEPPSTLAAFSPDGERLARFVARTVQIEQPDGGVLHRLDAREFPLGTLAFTGDGRSLLAGGRAALYLWDVATGRRLASSSLKFFDVVADARPLADGALVLHPRRAGRISLWQTATGRHLRALEGPGEIGAIDVSADEQRLVAAHGDRLGIWELASGEQIGERTLPDRIEALAFLPAGHRFVTSCGGRLQLGDPAGGEGLDLGSWEPPHTPSRGTRLAFAGDSRWLFAGGGRLSLLDLEKREDARLLIADQVERFAISGDGSWALVRTTTAETLYFLDWELEPRDVTRFGTQAAPWLDDFLTRRTPLGGDVATATGDAELAASLSRRGRPRWDESQLGELLETLGRAGWAGVTSEQIVSELRSRAAERAVPSPPERGAGGAARFRLSWEEGRRERTFDLEEGEYRIGRSEECEIRVNDVGLSRLHARIAISSGEARLRDAKSKGGTHVNGHAVVDAVLHDGDEIRLGMMQFRFGLAEAADGPPRSRTRPENVVSPRGALQAMDQETLSSHIRGVWERELRNELHSHLDQMAVYEAGELAQRRGLKLQADLVEWLQTDASQQRTIVAAVFLFAYWAGAEPIDERLPTRLLAALDSHRWNLVDQQAIACALAQAFRRLESRELRDRVRDLMTRLAREVPEPVAAFRLALRLTLGE